MRGDTVERFLFSVILPVYQVERYLEKCLSSLTDQCGEDVQIVLVDDGSTDGSPEILDRYLKRYSNIEVITQPNAGVSHARNVGLQKASGEYLLWVDPDDWVTPDWLGTIRERIAATKPDMLLFDYIITDGATSRKAPYGRAGGSITPEEFMHDLTEDLRLTSVLWNKVIRRELFQGLTFDETLRCMEDADILCRLVPRVKTIEYVAKALYYYRIRPNGLVLTPDPSVAWRCWQLAMEREEAVRAMGCATSEVGGYLQAKGFLCKFYRLGFPKDWRDEYEQVRRWLQGQRRNIWKKTNLSPVSRIKYMLIGNPVVGTAYALVKKVQIRLKTLRGGTA